MKLFGEKNKVDCEVNLRREELKWPTKRYNARRARRGADALVVDAFQADPQEKSSVAAQQIAILAAQSGSGFEGITISAMEALK